MPTVARESVPVPREKTGRKIAKLASQRSAMIKPQGPGAKGKPVKPNAISPKPGDQESDSWTSGSSKDDVADHRLEDQITNERLKQLQRNFEIADEDGGGGLDIEEFRNAMRKAMGQHLTDEELDTMFMKVDTNCDGTVDWDEYLSYMLLEYREKDAMQFAKHPKPFPPTPYVVHNMAK